MLEIVALLGEREHIYFLVGGSPCRFPWVSSWTFPWSNRQSLRHPRWSWAEDACVSVGTCPRHLQFKGKQFNIIWFSYYVSIQVFLIIIRLIIRHSVIFKSSNSCRLRKVLDLTMAMLLTAILHEPLNSSFLHVFTNIFLIVFGKLRPTSQKQLQVRVNETPIFSQR